MPDALPDMFSRRALVRDLLDDVARAGGAVRLSGAGLVIDTADFTGSPELIEALGACREEAVGFLASKVPREPLPAFSAADLAPQNLQLSAAQRQWTDVDRNPVQEQWLPVLWRLEGTLNIEAMKRSFQRLMERHAILRTRYVHVHGETRPDVLPADAVRELELVDLACFPRSEAEMEIWRVMRARYEHPATLDEGVVDLRLYRLSGQHHILGGFVHHVAMDAASLAIILGELMARHYGELFGQESGAEEPRQYADFAAWERSWLSEDDRRLSDAVWTYELADARPAKARKRSALQSSTAFDALPFATPEATLDAALRCARAQGVTLNMMVLTVLSVALARARGETQALFGQILHGRPAAFSKVVGSFIQMRPFFLAFDEKEAFGDVLKRGRRMYTLSSDLRRTASASLVDRFGIGKIVVNYSRRDASEDLHAGLTQPSRQEHRGVFSTTSIRKSGGPEERSEPPGAPAYFSAPMLLASAGSLSQPGREELAVTRRSRSAAGPRKMLGLAASMTRLPMRLQTEFHRDLHIAVVQSPEALNGVITFAEDAFDRGSIERMSNGLLVMLDAVSRNPDIRLSELIDAMR
jgi:hypothetical protein